MLLRISGGASPAAADLGDGRTRLSVFTIGVPVRP